MVDLDKALNSAIRAAREAGDFIFQRLGKVQGLEFKGERNLVTDVDKKAEEKIKQLLKERFPDIPILGEELDKEIKTEKLLWLVDPLDGTNNFFHTFPIFCVSIALLEEGKALVGVIYDPVHDELFHAIKGKGAYLNERKIKVSETAQIEHSLLATGFYYDFKDQPDTNIEHFVDFLYIAQGIRRTGSAAIDLAWVASGRLDGYWELGLKPWDMAAGWLIVEEAGGKVSKLDGSDFDPFYPEIVASNGLIHARMIEILSKGR
jgi:myo-inositol-1(or 4)-monophosphatase